MLVTSTLFLSYDGSCPIKDISSLKLLLICYLQLLLICKSPKFCHLVELPQCRTKDICLLQAISPFPTKFSTSIWTILKFYHLAIGWDCHLSKIKSGLSTHTTNDLVRNKIVYVVTCFVWQTFLWICITKVCFITNIEFSHYIRTPYPKEKGPWKHRRKGKKCL